jgi:hypothetical protein
MKDTEDGCDIRALPKADVPLPLGSGTVLDLNYQLLTEKAHND